MSSAAVWPPAVLHFHTERSLRETVVFYSEAGGDVDFGKAAVSRLVCAVDIGAAIMPRVRMRLPKAFAWGGQLMPKDKMGSLVPDRPLFMLLDGHSIVYRAYYALSPRMQLNIRSTGEPIGAVYGFANMFLKAWSDVKPKYWAIAFDRPGKTFRDEMYTEYKAGRPSAPEELSAQFDRVRQLVDALGMPILESDGYEADDILGTLSHLATGEGIDTMILTGDTDATQLVSPHVRLRLQSRVGDTTIYDIEKVRERYGLEPSQYIDYKSLRGDPSDNIPNIPGIGDKKATRLLQQFGSIDGIYEHIGEVTPDKEREVLQEYQDRVRQNQKLVRLVTDMPIQFDFEQARADRFDRQQVVDLFREMEFHTLIGRLPPLDQERTGSPMAQKEEQPRDFQVVDSAEQLAVLVQDLRAAGRFAIDVQSSSQLAMAGGLVGLAFSVSAGMARYVPMEHIVGKQIEKRTVLEELKPVLEDPTIDKIAHNGKYDWVVLANEGIELKGVVADITVAAYLVGAKSLTLKAMAFEKLGYELPTRSDLLGTGAKAITMAQLPIAQCAEYACSKAELTQRLWPLYKQELVREEQVELFDDLEMPLMPVLANMEHRGIALETGVLHAMSRAMTDRLFEIEKGAYDSVGHMFNIASPQQLSQVLFEEIGLPKSKRTKIGYSTDARVLEGLRALHPVIDYVLEYRQVTKLKSTYVDALPEMVNPTTNRVHTTLSQTVAATGRLSSSDPNLQNIPVRTEQGRRIREAFVAENAPGWTLLSADYSQIELRILAHMSQDEGLIEAFSRDEDVHTATASQVFDVPIKEVTSDQRRFAKVVNFGLVYGMGEFGLAVRTERSREEAAPIIEEYFAKYPGILGYLEETKNNARAHGYVQTMMGRRRHLPEVRAANFQVRSAAERMAVNMPIQGTAADIVKVAMIRLEKRMQGMELRGRMILQVHDELLFETPVEELETLKQLVNEIMPHAMDLDVPLKVDMKQGRTWGEMG